MHGTLRAQWSRLSELSTTPRAPGTVSPMKSLAVLTATAIILLLTGCASPGTAEETTPPTSASSTPAPTRTTTTPSPTPTPTTEASGADWKHLLWDQDFLTVESATETQPGRVEILTGLEDPGGGYEGSMEAQVAIEICEATVALGATNVVVQESNGSSWILYGHPSVGDVCTEV